LNVILHGTYTAERLIFGQISGICPVSLPEVWANGSLQAYGKVYSLNLAHVFAIIAQAAHAELFQSRPSRTMYYLSSNLKPCVRDRYFPRCQSQIREIADYGITLNLAVPIDQLFELRDERAIDRYGAHLADRGR